jgi:hypothetical protein
MSTAGHGTAGSAHRERHRVTIASVTRITSSPPISDGIAVSRQRHASATELTLAPAQRANSASGVTRQLARSIGPRGCAFAALVVAGAVAVAADVGPLPSIWRPDPAPAAVVVAAVIAGVDERPAERKPTEAAMMEEAAPVMEPEP